MLAIVAFVAFGCVSLSNATATWACMAFTGAVIILLISAVGIVYGESERRAYCIGTSLFGWTYLLLSFAPGFMESTRPHLLTTPLLDLLHRQVERWIELPKDYPGFLRESESLGIVVVPDTARDRYEMWAGAAAIRSAGRGGYSYGFPIAEHFHTVGHALFAILFATAGGLVARFYYSTNGRCTDSGNA
jgi:hypothetical protein